MRWGGGAMRLCRWVDRGWGLTATKLDADLTTLDPPRRGLGCLACVLIFEVRVVSAILRSLLENLVCWGFPSTFIDVASSLECLLLGCHASLRIKKLPDFQGLLSITRPALA